MSISRKDLFEIMPDCVLELPYLSFDVEPMGDNKLGYTDWDTEKMLFKVLVKESVDKETAKAVLYHELNHVIMGHFDHPTCHPMYGILCTETEANWWLKQSPKFKDKVVTEGMVQPEELYEMLGIDFDKWTSAYLLHMLGHHMVKEMTVKEFLNEMNRCGGITPTEDAGAKVASIIIGAKLNEEREKAKAQGKPDPFEGALAGGAEYGTVGGNSELVIRTSKTPQWVHQMVDFVKGLLHINVGDEETFTRPNRLARKKGLLLPTLRERWAPIHDCLVIQVDSSGSMSNELQFINAALLWANRQGFEIHLIAGDVKVLIDKVITPKNPVKVKWLGLGGTDIVPLMKRALELKPKATICITDGYVPSYPSNPGIPVLWIGPHNKPPYGKWVKFDREQQ